jgi:hypothetical protein
LDEHFVVERDTSYLLEQIALLIIAGITKNSNKIILGNIVTSVLAKLFTVYQQF